MKTIAVVLTLAISGIAISAAYTEAYASRMNGRRSLCSDDVGCTTARGQNTPSQGPRGIWPSLKWATKHSKNPPQLAASFIANRNPPA
jgi:hypothetical protein